MLTRREAHLLQMMDDGEEMVQEGRCVYVGLERTSPAIVFRWLRRMWISEDSYQHTEGNYYIYGINQRGKKALEEHKKALDTESEEL